MNTQLIVMVVQKMKAKSALLLNSNIIDIELISFYHLSLKLWFSFNATILFIKNE